MAVVIVGIGAAIGVALLGRAVTTTASRARAWYRGSWSGSMTELVVLAALIGGLLGELYQHLRP